jgi:transcriptional regulator with XRE-family HTH domain
MMTIADAPRFDLFFSYERFMSIIVDDPSPRIAARLHAERKARDWSLETLAARSGVSKAMISRIERGEASPTAALLGRLSGAFGLTLSALLARAEGHGGRLMRAADQPRWRDPETGYLRRQVSPPSDLPMELIAVGLPPGESVSFPASAYAFIRQLVWVLDGQLTFVEGTAVHILGPGDCLELGPPADCTFRNDAEEPCSYLVAVLRK